MGVRKNPFVEEWAYKRENSEIYLFKYSRANWARLAVFGIGVPVGLYYLITSEMVRLLIDFTSLFMLREIAKEETHAK